MRKPLFSIFLSLFVGAALIVALVAPPTAAKGPPNGGETTLGNNLSVPAIFVPDTTGAPALRLPCGPFQAPGADGVLASDVYPGYWLQKTEATWTADCATAASASVIADWGDNLTTSPTLAAGRPIRVEVGLLADATMAATGQTGYVVTNLTPDLEDRYSTYGTDGTAFLTGATGAPLTRIWDAGANLLIEKLVNGTPTETIFSGPITAEINSTGTIVYGYNWGSSGAPPAAGTYRLTFTTSTATTITGIADVEGIRLPTFSTHSTALIVTLGTSSGGRPTLTVTTVGSGTVAVVPAPDAIVLNDVVTLTATPNSGSLFLNWTVDDVNAGWANPLTITMAASHTVVVTFATIPVFSDVAGSPYAAAIAQLATREIIKGYGDGTFGPNDITLRAQMAALIARAMGWDTEDWGNPFLDQGTVDDDLWRNVGTLAHYGVAHGYPDGTFRPSDPVLHVQTILFISRAMVAGGYWTLQADTNPYPNLPNGTAQEQADRVDVATFIHYAGAIPGAPTGQPWVGYDQPATRGWFAQVEWQALNSQFGVDTIP